MTATYQERQEMADRFEEVLEEMHQLLGEALSLVEQAYGCNSVEAERARRCWYANMRVELNDDHTWLARGSHTMQHTLEEMREEEEDPLSFEDEE